MKKFSKITGEKISKEPEVSNDITDYDVLKYKIHSLMDSYLGVQMYGPITRYSVAGSVKVIGKEIFIEALMNVLEEFSSKEKVKLLESLKYQISDWNVIDGNINTINENINLISNSKLTTSKNKIKFFIEKYKNNDELFDKIKSSSLKIKDPETLKLRSIAAKKMISENSHPSNILEKISEIYNNRYLDSQRG
jgi:hypothetical protein